MLRNLCASGAAGVVFPACAGAPALRTSIDGGKTLRSAAQSRGILYGAAVNTAELRDRTFTGVLAREATILVPEYEMKRAIVERRRGPIDLSGCDAIAAFAHEHGMRFRGHPLVWHKRNPDWLEEAVRTSRDETLLTSYIEDILRHFGGRVHSWDVVNEAIAPDDGRADSLRRSFWVDAFGPAYIDIAYHVARAADPDALLVYNDWGCELGAPANDRFRAATLDFLEHAIARGVPIQALGLQGHLRAFGTPVDQGKLAVFLAHVRALGLRILVTEHDVDDTGGPSDVKLRDRAVADTSRRFLDVVVDSAPVAVLTWGLSDRFLDSPGPRAELADSWLRMLPLDRDFQRKPMWRAIADAFTAV
ncbi:MAG TPA: endo-1,4-beta-xylanase [Rhizomicrobium sp.]|nr:endo-1,4-beta-xylanase [Rhizomicrobium sp.]